MKLKGIHTDMENPVPRHLSGVNWSNPVLSYCVLTGKYYGTACTPSFLDNQGQVLGQLLGDWWEET